MESSGSVRGRGRPAVSSRAHVEAIAMELFTTNGFAATTVPMIAEASGVGRATVFRYWGSKSEIVWAEFDRHIERLATRMEAERASTEQTLDVVRRVVVSNLGQSIEDSRVWFARFALVDESEELRAEEARHWEDWSAPIAAFIAVRHGYPRDGVIPQSIAGALQRAFVAVLRSRTAAEDNSAAVLLPILDRTLAALAASLQEWIDGDLLGTGDS